MIADRKLWGRQCRDAVIEGAWADRAIDGPLGVKAARGVTG